MSVTTNQMLQRTYQEPKFDVAQANEELSQARVGATEGRTAQEEVIHLAENDKRTSTQLRDQADTFEQEAKMLSGNANMSKTMTDEERTAMRMEVQKLKSRASILNAAADRKDEEARPQSINSDILTMKN